MKAGLLNCRVELQQRVPGKDPGGQPIDVWEHVTGLWANIKYQSGIAAIRADAQTSISKVSIMIRYRKDVVPGMRVVYGSTVFSVDAVLPDETQRDRLYLVCGVS